MGVYWYPANVTKKQFIDPHAVGCGVKIGEWSDPESPVWRRIDALTAAGYWALDDTVVAVSDAGGLMVLRGSDDHGLVVDGNTYDQLEQEYEDVSIEPLGTALNAEPGDAPLPEDDAIRDAHPLRTHDHATYAEAMRLVGAKHSKRALVDLVNWLLASRRDAREGTLREVLATCDVCGRPSGGCCAVVIGSPGVAAVDRYRGHIRALAAKGRL